MSSRVAAVKDKKEFKVIEKTEHSLEKVDDEGGQYMSKTDILKRKSCIVLEDDAKQEKSG